jgi:hypothetical protein
MLEPLRQITTAQSSGMALGLVQAVRGDVSNDEAGELIAGYVREMLEARSVGELTVGDVITLTKSMAAVWSSTAALAARLADPSVTKLMIERGPDEVIQRVALRLAGGQG